MDLATVDHLLSTTRSVRKRLDFSRPVEPEVVQRCIDLALQAPTGGNSQGWSFVVVSDAAKRRAIADLYRKAFDIYRNDPSVMEAYAKGDERHQKQLGRVIDSAIYLAEHLHEAPVMVIACIEGRVENAGVLMQAGLYGSILPAAWSFMLALRSRGLGTAWTTLHLMFEAEVAKLLGIPDNITQTALFPVAYYTGDDFKPATRQPSARFVHWDSWGATRG
ncbi:MAG: nitroreductase family protein [Gammaproteobacteria bacterium]|jgi:nitroreductase|nr:nitroreductase family protein [Gammaproteobacteria bacterium]